MQLTVPGTVSSMVPVPQNIVSDWFRDLANSMADSLANTKVEIVKQIAETSLPSKEQVSSQWYMFGLGGTYGLATKISLMVIVIVGLIIILTPLSNHVVRMKRVVQSVIVVGAFGVLFFPLYSIAWDLVMAGVQGMINMALGKENSTLDEAAAAMTKIFLPEDVWFKVIVAFLGLIFAFFAFLIAWGNFFLVLATGMFFPIAHAVRPISEKFNSLVHIANSALVTSLLTPLIIVGGLLLPAFVENLVPGVGSSGISAGIFTLIGVVISFVGPLFVAMWAFKGSQRVIGNLDYGTISGSVDINSMPPRSVREMNDSVKESGLVAFGSSMLAGGVTAQLGKSDDLLGDVKKLAIEGGAAAAAATGHPVAAGALNSIDTTLTKEKRKHAAGPASAPQSTRSSVSDLPPPTGDPVQTSVPPSVPGSSSSDSSKDDDAGYL